MFPDNGDAVGRDIVGFARSLWHCHYATFRGLASPKKFANREVCSASVCCWGLVRAGSINIERTCIPPGCVLVVGGLDC